VHSILKIHAFSVFMELVFIFFHREMFIPPHPASKERAGYIREHGKNSAARPESVLSPQTWDELQKELNE
jgi:hypothetical protein